MKTTPTSLNTLPSPGNSGEGFLSRLRHNIATKAFATLLASSTASYANLPPPEKSIDRASLSLGDNTAQSNLFWQRGGLEILTGSQGEQNPEWEQGEQGYIGEEALVVTPQNDIYMTPTEMQDEYCVGQYDARTKLLYCYLSRLPDEYTHEEIASMVESLDDEMIPKLLAAIQIISGENRDATTVSTALRNETIIYKKSREISENTEKDTETIALSMFQILQIMTEIDSKYEGLSDDDRAGHDADILSLVTRYPELQDIISSMSDVTLRGTLE